MSVETKGHLRLQLRHRLPLFFPAEVTTWDRMDTYTLRITCEWGYDSRGLSSLGHRQFTVYHFPLKDVEFWGSEGESLLG